MFGAHGAGEHGTPPAVQPGQDGTDHQLRHAVPQSLFYARRKSVHRFLDRTLVSAVLCVHLRHRGYFPHRHGALQVPRETHHLPLGVLHVRVGRLHRQTNRRARKSGVQPGVRRGAHPLRDDRPRALHRGLPPYLLFRHGQLHLVGHPLPNLVPGGRDEVGQRGDRQLLSVLPPGRLAYPQHEVHRGPGAELRGWRLGGWHLLRGEPEPGQPAGLRPRAFGDLFIHRDDVPAGWICVAVQDPQRHQAGRHQN